MTNIDLKNFEKLKEKKKKITLNYFTGNLIYMIKMLSLQLLIVSLPLSPILLLLIMLLIEFLYIAFNISSHFLYNNFTTFVVLVSRLSQSLALVVIYINFYLVFLHGIKGEDTLIYQKRSILLIIIGVLLEYFFMIVMMVLMVVKKIKERREKKEGKVVPK